METPTTRTDRLAQARAEAERRYPHHGEDIGDAYGYGHFMDGWLAADANPKPRAITRAQREVLLTDGAVERAARALFDHDRDGGPGPEWGMASEHVRQEYYGLVRAALTAALGEEEQ